MLAPAPTTPRRFGTPITNTTPTPSKSPFSAAKKVAPPSKSPAFKQPTPKPQPTPKQRQTPKAVAPPPAREEEEHSVFGRFGVLQAKRGPTPPEASAFGAAGVLERERGNAPADVEVFGGITGVLMRERGPTPKATRREQLEANEVAAFVDAHDDATMGVGRVRCETTRHEMPEQLDVLVSHWGGRRYKKTAKAAQAVEAVPINKGSGVTGLTKRKKPAELPLLDDEDVGVVVIVDSELGNGGVNGGVNDGNNDGNGNGNGGLLAGARPPKGRSKKSRVRSALAADGTRIDTDEWAERWTLVRSKAEKSAERKAAHASKKEAARLDREHAQRKKAWMTHVQDFLGRQREREMAIQRERALEAEAVQAEAEAAAALAEAEADAAEVDVAAAVEAEAEAVAASAAAAVAAAAMEAAQEGVRMADAALEAALAAAKAAAIAAAPVPTEELPPTRSVLDTPQSSRRATRSRLTGRGAEDRESRAAMADADGSDARQAPRSRGTPAGGGSSAEGEHSRASRARSRATYGAAAKATVTFGALPSSTPVSARAATIALRAATPAAAPSPMSVCSSSSSSPSYADVAAARASPESAPAPATTITTTTTPGRATTPASRGVSPPPSAMAVEMPSAPSVQFVRRGSQLPFGIPAVEESDDAAAAISFGTLLETIDGMKVAELKDALGVVGQPRAGVKSELAARLKGAITPAKARAGPPPAPTPRSTRSAAKPTQVAAPAPAPNDGIAPEMPPPPMTPAALALAAHLSSSTSKAVAAPTTATSAAAREEAVAEAAEVTAMPPPPSTRGAHVLSCVSRSEGIATPNVAARRVLRSTAL